MDIAELKEKYPSSQILTNENSLAETITKKRPSNNDLGLKTFEGELMHGKNAGQMVTITYKTPGGNEVVSGRIAGALTKDGMQESNRVRILVGDEAEAILVENILEYFIQTKSTRDDIIKIKDLEP